MGTRFVNVCKIRVETEKGTYTTYALADDRGTYLKKNVDRYARECARKHKAKVVFYDVTLLTRVRADAAHQLVMNYVTGEERVA